jgi:chemotaxis protein methyltransferase CheR
LKEKIFPEFFSSKTARIWSAGCATGEEPYSLAILANECKSRSTKDLQVTIYASDVDRDALAKAARGKYDLKSLQGVEQSLVDKYFAREGELFSVKDFVKQSVRFERHDLMTSPSHQNLDLVLCRNVMIYFSRESQQKIHMHFYDSLKEGGYLVIGKTEMLSGEPSKKFVCVDSGTRIYKKTKETIGFEKPTTLPVAYLK